MNSAFIWIIALAVIAGILFRPKQWPEAIWACLGAALLVILGLLPIRQAGVAVAKGVDVYLFLTGMMLLSELARREGVFDWLAGHAVTAARSSQTRLFGLVYLVGILVTVFLSNDATAVVLTPAVYASVKKARTPALPYLLVCAFIANAASFVLPISNPANLVVYGKSLPPLFDWLKTFLIPSLFAIAVTYLALRWSVRAELQGSVADGHTTEPLTAPGRLAAFGILFTGAVLLVASALGRDLGLPACLAASLVTLLAIKADWRRLCDVLRGVSWSVLPLVAGLFVVVEALNQAGALGAIRSALEACAQIPYTAGALLASFGIAALSNLMNNLPSGLLAAGAVQAGPIAPQIRDAVLIGVDLGPNLSVTGSLATVLWLIALRREGERVSGLRFLKVGLVVMPPALLAATLALSLR